MQSTEDPEVAALRLYGADTEADQLEIEHGLAAATMGAVA